MITISLICFSSAQTSFGAELVGSSQQKAPLTYVEKQPVSTEEMMLLQSYGNVDHITAGHGPGPRPVPVPAGRVYASDVFFWAGFSLIMLSVIIYPY